MNKLYRIIIGLIFISTLFKAPVFAAENIAASSGQLTLDKNSTEQKKGLSARIRKVEAFLGNYNSPLEPFAKTFVEKADEYELDWKMVVAISGVESTFGKKIPASSYNAWGWGIPTGASYGIGFENWEDGINTVSKGLKEKYIDKGADTVYKIAPVYAPPSKTWAGNVTFFMEKLDTVVVPPELSI